MHPVLRLRLCGLHHVEGNPLLVEANQEEVDVAVL